MKKLKMEKKSTMNMKLSLFQQFSSISHNVPKIYLCLNPFIHILNATLLWFSLQKKNKLFKKKKNLKKFKYKKGNCYQIQKLFKHNPMPNKIMIMLLSIK